MVELLKLQPSFDAELRPILVATFEIQVEPVHENFQRLSREELAKLLGEKFVNCIDPDCPIK